ncbi:MAG: PAS domain S-box protein, partial [Nitrospirota bacterium]|nr:PAS domain S-box protein [Nitrospirota bacterium]
MPIDKDKIGTDLDFLRDLINRSNDAIFVVDLLSGLFIFVNDKACASLGYDRQELLTMGVMDIEAAFPDNFSWQTHVNELRQKGSLIFEGTHKRKNGTAFPVESNTSYVVLNTKEYLIAVVRDITARKQAEEALRESEEKFRSLVETTTDWIWEINENGFYTYVSPKVKDMLGYEPEELIGKSPFSLMPQEEADRVAREVQSFMENKKPFSDVKNINKHKDGRLIVLETSGMPVFNVNGVFCGYRGIDRDITEREQMEAALLRMQKLESVGTLAGGIAHDFNNLLQGIFGYISMAKLTHDQKEKSLAMLEQAEQALHMSVNLTTQLLTFSKGGKPVMKKIMLKPVIENAVKFSLSGSKVDYRINIDEDLWMVEADEGQIGQVIQNIVINAD